MNIHIFGGVKCEVKVLIYPLLNDEITLMPLSLV